MKFDTIEVKGKKFDVEVYSDGKWSALWQGSRLTADTLDELKEKLARAVKSAKVTVRIPFCQWQPGNRYSVKQRDPGQIRTGVITGLHAANNNLLLKYDDSERSEQVGNYGVSLYPPECAKELEKLQLALNAAEQAMRDYAGAHELEPEELVKAEIANQLGAEASKGSES